MLFVIAGVAFALPQAPVAPLSGATQTTQPAATTTTNSGTPLKGIAGFGGLALDLNIDKAKATLEPSG